LRRLGKGIPRKEASPLGKKKLISRRGEQPPFQTSKTKETYGGKKCSTEKIVGAISNLLRLQEDQK